MEDIGLDRALNLDEERKVSQLSEAERSSIDAMLLSNVSERWCKVSLIVGITMTELPERKFGIPDLYYAKRLQSFVDDGTLESRGSLGRMRYSEVRFSTTSDRKE